MNERNLEELRRRVQRAEQDGTYGRQHLLDRMELVLEEAAMDTSDGLARRIAEGLAAEPDEWGKWVTYSEDDYLSWKIVQSLVEILWKREPEALRRGPLFYWIVWVSLSIGEPPIPRRPRGRDARLHEFRNIVIAVTVDRLRNLPDGPAIWSGPRNSACHLVARRLKSMGRKRGRKPDTIHKIWKSYRSRIKDAGLFGTTPSWVGKVIPD